MEATHNTTQHPVTTSNNNTTTTTTTTTTPTPPESGIRPGDWLCAPCNEINFSSRSVCRRCAAPPASGAHSVLQPTVTQGRGGRGGRQGRGGRGTALTLNTGNGTHFTVTYFFSMSTSREEIMKQTLEWCAANVKQDTLDIKVGEMWGRNSIRVEGPLADFKTNMTSYFDNAGYNVDTGRRGQTAHIAINTKPASSLNDSVNLLSDWHWM
eukprot:TRINITY_DN116_c1_g1_i1.p1 TRINITY_DN116_c1_g1~~TRINITY_DN116_c1_g1_i1.p1  ORF type:complete len:210 (+),score=37.51 TRINITY_DN116_c1_g1_i1:121-750(+)